MVTRRLCSIDSKEHSTGTSKPVSKYEYSLGIMTVRFEHVDAFWSRINQTYNRLVDYIKQ